MIIAIDGLAVNGKSTLARKIADELNFKYFNTGAIYRCIALEVINQKLDINRIDDVINKLSNINVDFVNEKVLLNNVDVTSEIRTELISIKSTEWGTILKIKELVRKIQKDFIKNNNTVIEGRDICTRIAPNADVKFYLYSDFEIRLNRLCNVKKDINREELKNNLLKIDELDLTGGNFIKPINAIELNTTNLNLQEVYNIMIDKIKEKM